MTPLSIQPHEECGQLRSSKRTIELALTRGVREFPAKPDIAKRLRKTVQFAKHVYEAVSTSPKGRAIMYGSLLAVATLAVLVSPPQLYFLLWPGMAWALLVVSAIVAIGVIVNILVAMTSMYVGYRPANEFAGTIATPNPVRRDMKFVDSGSKITTEPRRRLVDTLNDLRLVEDDLSKLEDPIVFQSLPDQQKRQYYQALEDVRTMIHEMLNEMLEKKIAS